MCVCVFVKNWIFIFSAIQCYCLCYWWSPWPLVPIPTTGTGEISGAVRWGVGKYAKGRQEIIKKNLYLYPSGLSAKQNTYTRYWEDKEKECVARIWKHYSQTKKKLTKNYIYVLFPSTTASTLTIRRWITRGIWWDQGAVEDEDKVVERIYFWTRIGMYMKSLRFYSFGKMFSAFGFHHSHCVGVCVCMCCIVVILLVNIEVLVKVFVFL